MSTIVLLLLGGGFVLLALQGWRMRAAADPASTVEGFARVLAAIDPEARTALDGSESLDPAEAANDRG